MSILSRAIALSLLLMPLQTAPADARLIRQSSNGIERTCVYPPRFSSRGRGGVLDRFVRIGAGEPCPSTYPGERRERAAPVPSLATLKEQVRENGRVICVYSYLGREYRREAAAGSRCNQTPN